jgi:aryl-alcohol dehydrogenase-like predicted oxidoreductase
VFGKVRAIGASNFTAERLAESLKVSATTGLPRYESLLLGALDLKTRRRSARAAR